MAILIPAMATAGASGVALGKKIRLPQVARKSKRMQIIATNGLLGLLPSAVFLTMRAGDGSKPHPFNCTIAHIRWQMSY